LKEVCTPCPHGEIGSHARLKILCSKERAGSNPAVGTYRKGRNMMQIVKVDEDAYDVRMNLDTIRRLGALAGDERDNVIATGFRSAHERLTQPETSETE
jgi:hypothetical protein